jgi:molybdopterin molybdotransferase
VSRFTAAPRLMTVEEALALLDGRLAPVTAVETVPLAAALFRILAEDVVSPLDVPPHRNAAMDGWAFRLTDLPENGPPRLPVAGRVAAGHPLGGPLPHGAAVRIFTGAAMPAGADTVAMQEVCTPGDGWVELPATARRGDHVRQAGEDIAAGAAVLSAGTRLRPQELGVAAAMGLTALAVRRPLKAAVFSTGDEIRDPGTILPPGCIHDSNRFTTAGLLRALGAEVTDLGILPDRVEAIRDAMVAAAGSHDLLITSGGVSEGEEDHVKAAVEACGSLHFWRLAIKPGKPVALGEVAGTPFIGLPGNPVAVMVTFMLLARPVALRLMGAADPGVTRFPVEAAFACRHRPGRREYPRVRLSTAPGRLVAEKYPSDGSGVLSSMVWADGLVEIAEGRGDIAPGDMVDFLPFAEMLR